ncbi:transmembrane protein 214-like [Pteropus vampyrus]|uniref:Transmembrane protein 214-like n=1 Tax=Pteropus vampyrus TaxID=132908 RepID=A0A6P3RQR9_PTEVA|nr:transmembrane protein 214-like [Pteropus vampyrus]
MKKELLSSLTECLMVDPLSASVWRQLYPKHLSQSSLLLKHLLRSWERIPKKTRKFLQETIQFFKLTNQELLRKGSCNNHDVITCDTACKVPAPSPPQPTNCCTSLSWHTLGRACIAFLPHLSLEPSLPLGSCESLTLLLGGLA